MIFLVNIAIMNAQRNKDDNDVRNWHAFGGPLGDILYNGRSFFALKEGRLLGAYSTLEEAKDSLRSAKKTERSSDEPKEKP
jgi:hypothetical protein